MKRKRYIKNQFAKILKKYNYNLNTGDIVAGTIIHRENKGFLVDIGNKAAGYLPIEEIKVQTIKKNKYNIGISLVNSTREFFLIEQNSVFRQSILSIKRIEYIRGWKRIKQFYLEDIIFKLKIKYLNKGGIITYLEEIQSFIPKSHILKKINSVNQKNIKCKLLIINEQKNQIILSNKSAILALSKHQFKLGEILYGKITSIRPYGIFINIYKIIALLHISENNYQYVNNIYLNFYLGQIIKVKIIHIDKKQGRLSVSQRNIRLKNNIN
uniref:Ribosomal protein S1 n=1 Tax=Dasyclonium flaccidum TaxID=2007274 RepID=A0A1Z1MLI3_9FLOR|nr:ribosomal protein S1 [Dasyclonium flaccidum]ARW66719.1 ribosomal protein S1 [Dasyclonium flaccidum]